MSPSKVVRMTSAGFVLGGLLTAAWTVSAPWGSFAGAERGASLQWVVSHTFHYLAALCLLLGLLGLAVQRLARADRFETVAQLGLLVAMWVWGGTGAITAAIWPMMSRHAPPMVEPDGAMFSPHPEFLQTAAVPALSIGIALIAIAMRRARFISAPVLALTLVGAALFWVPTDPITSLPWIIFPTAGTLSGIGVALIGLALRNGAAPAAAPAASSPHRAAEPVAV